MNFEGSSVYLTIKDKKTIYKFLCDFSLINASIDEGLENAISDFVEKLEQDSEKDILTFKDSNVYLTDKDKEVICEVADNFISSYDCENEELNDDIGNLMQKIKQDFQDDNNYPNICTFKQHYF